MFLSDLASLASRKLLGRHIRVTWDRRVEEGQRCWYPKILRSAQQYELVGNFLSCLLILPMTKMISPRLRRSELIILVLAVGMGAIVSAFGAWEVGSTGTAYGRAEVEGSRPESQQPPIPRLSTEPERRVELPRSLDRKPAGAGAAVELGSHPHDAHRTARRLAWLEDADCNESSGLACSRMRAEVFWSHNDSGDRGRLFCFDLRGRNLGQYELPSIKPRDCDDMASFIWKDVPSLVLADVGDNARRRSELALYWFAEPVAEVRECGSVSTIRFRYEDGAHDCEAVTVDVQARLVLLVTKTIAAPSAVYQLTIPDDFPQKPLRAPLIAKKIGMLPVPLATGMDLTTDGRRLIIGTYLQAYLYERQEAEAWPVVFARPPREIPLPKRRQGESICWDAEGQALLLTSEKTPTPLWMMKP